MGANFFNKFTMIELERRLKYHKEKSRTRNINAAMMARIKCNLFGSLPGGDCRIHVEGEMSVIAQHDTKKWNFDFNQEKPIICRDAQFVWKLTNENKQAPLRQTKITDYFSGKRKGDTYIGRKAKQPRISTAGVPQVLLPK